MSMILDPHERLRELNRQIQQKEAAIRKENASYDALCRFKGEVERAQGDFHAVNGRDSQIMEPLQPLQPDNPVVNKYVRGMSGSLHSVGAGLVGHVFEALLGLIFVEQKAICWRVNQYESELGWLKLAKREAEAEIRLLESGKE